MDRVNVIMCMRVLVGMIFVWSGLGKLLSPTENFLYVIQAYQVLPWPGLERAVALVYPWAETALGLFLLLGLWTRLSLWGTGLMTCSFIFVVGQAILRKLPIESCGCFGELMKVPLPVMAGIDWAILAGIIWMMRHRSQADALSLDRFFAGKA